MRPRRVAPGERPVYKNVTQVDASEHALNIGLTLNEASDEAIVHINTMGGSPDPHPEDPDGDPELQIRIRRIEDGSTIVTIGDETIWTNQ